MEYQLRAAAAAAAYVSLRRKTIVVDIVTVHVDQYIDAQWQNTALASQHRQKERVEKKEQKTHMHAHMMKLYSGRFMAKQS